MAADSKRDRDIRFTRKELWVFIPFVFAAMGVMFVLGIYVGRGMSPVRFDIQNLQKELAGLKAAMVRAEEAQAEALEKEIVRQGDFDFYSEMKKSTDDLMFFPKDQPAPDALPAPALSKAPVEPAKTAPAAKRPDAPAAKPQAAPMQDDYNFWTIQIAAMARKDDGTRMVDKFIKMGYPAYLMEAHPESGKTIYRVRLGHYTSREAAEKAGIALSKDWKDYMVIRK